MPLSATAAAIVPPNEDVRLETGAFIKTAPRLPASKGSLADLASRRLSFGVGARSWFRSVIKAIEPWYDWNRTSAWRFDAETFEEADASEFECLRAELQWFGVHLGIAIGRMPAKAVR